MSFINSAGLAEAIQTRFEYTTIPELLKTKSAIRGGAPHKSGYDREPPCGAAPLRRRKADPRLRSLVRFVPHFPAFRLTHKP